MGKYQMADVVMLFSILGIITTLPFLSDVKISWNANYYPKILNQSEVSITYDGPDTVIHVKRHLLNISVACTGSMEPAMGCENTYLIEPLMPEDYIGIGDIIAYDRHDGHYLMHQITEKDEKNNCYYFKGINNIFGDREGCIMREDLKYRVIVVLPTKS
ncbi:MAG: hypothetical protein MN733_12385 [Nitrososphaera sp.]|nr:hypothetical protein [Nitrososphaera sp.]